MAPASEKITFEHKGIGTVLSQNTLAVPLNQREYSWEEEHVTDLLTDFSNAIASNKSAYFLGTIVLTGGGNVPEVSDGQQRLATTTILLAAIRDYFQSTGEAARVTYFENTFLNAIDPKTTQIIPKLNIGLPMNKKSNPALQETRRKGRVLELGRWAAKRLGDGE